MSVGFTSHYTRMRDRFGPHLVDGIAGENVLVAVDDQIEPEELLDGLDIALAGWSEGPPRAHHRGRAVHRVHPLRPATRSTCSRAARRARTGLRFLRYGMRGFYVSYTGEPVVLSVGDVVFAPG